MKCFYPDVTPFAPNCSEGAPVNAKADPLGLSLERLVQECPNYATCNLVTAAHFLALHGRGDRVHARESESGAVLCIPKGGSQWIASRRRFTDAQRDYWSRRPRL